MQIGGTVSHTNLILRPPLPGIRHVRDNSGTYSTQELRMGGRRSVHRFGAGGVLVAMLIATHAAPAQLAGTQVQGGCDVPATSRTAETGCYWLASEFLKALPAGDVFWHLYTYPTRAAAEAARRASAGTVVESRGKEWLFTIANSKWRPPAGDRVAVIGPLPVLAAKTYTARYMEAVFPPQQAMKTAVHQHSGPEAWYVLTGAQCLRTPDDVLVIRAGEGGFVRPGPSMVLTSIGTEMRRAVLLVLHDASQPWMTIRSDWVPTSECPGA
jgi:mannose-6-phosphate isomerase-like protein (cupin superfamily)